MTATLLLVAVVVACSGASEQSSSEVGTTDNRDSATSAPATPHDSLFAAITTLCGQAFAGRVIEDSANDPAFADAPLTMHVRSCTDSVLRIPFFVGDDRSRTWVITRTADGLRLKHDHRHEDGSEDAITQYGGDTRDAGSATSQSFAADSATAALIPAAATNVWSIGLEPGATFTYALRRDGTDRRFRVEFDLTRTIDTPAAPWGAARPE